MTVLLIYLIIEKYISAFYNKKSALTRLKRILSGSQICYKWIQVVYSNIKQKP